MCTCLFGGAGMHVLPAQQPPSPVCSRCSQEAQTRAHQCGSHDNQPRAAAPVGLSSRARWKTAISGVLCHSCRGCLYLFSSSLTYQQMAVWDSQSELRPSSRLSTPQLQVAPLGLRGLFLWWAGGELKMIKRESSQQPLPCVLQRCC